jgi:hypothetical protein
MALGLFVMSALLSGPITIGGATFDIHTMLYASTFIILGLQTVAFALFSKVFAISSGLLPEDARITSFLRIVNLERGLILGGLLSLAGMAGSIYAFAIWGRTSFGPLIPSITMRLAIPSVTFLAAGLQIIFASFFLSILQLRHK